MAAHDEREYTEAVEKCAEVMSFFRFSHDSTHSFRGTVCFELSVAGKTITRSVRVHDSHYVQLYNGEPSDGKIDCRVSMPFPVFTDVYWGKLHPLPLLMNGTIKLHGWSHGPVLKNFSTAFDFSTEQWEKFYDHQSTQTSSNGISSYDDAYSDEPLNPFIDSDDEEESQFSGGSDASDAFRNSILRKDAIVGDWSIPLDRRIWMASCRIPCASTSSDSKGIPEHSAMVNPYSGIGGQYGMVLRRVIGPSLRAGHPHSFVRHWSRLFRPTAVTNALRLV